MIRRLIVIAVFFCLACVDPYPPIATSDSGYLVVDGFINSAEGITTIHLARTVPLDADFNLQRPELNAILTVEGEDGDQYQYPLTSKGKGEYQGTHLGVEYGKKYRLHIKTKNNREYFSDAIQMKKTPSIDSVTWSLDRENNGLQVNVTTHDPDHATGYYQWDYEETWQYHSDYATLLEFKNDAVIFNPTIKIYDCWKSEKATKIFTASSGRLSEDIIYRYPLAFVNANSEKPQIAYSILVKQYAIAREEYEYLQQLKKSTEQMGTIFDPQPFALKGNLHGVTDPDEIVIGYVGARSVEEKRVFILNGGTLPAWFFTLGNVCPEDPNFIPNLLAFPALISIYLRSGYILPVGSSVEGAGYHLKSCVDCRTKGGTNIKPDYWPNVNE